MVDSVSAPDRHRLTARWSLRLFGSFELKEPGGARTALPGKRERALLAFLALSPKGRQPRRKLAALLWGDASDETLLDNLRTCIWRLRKALGEAGHRLLASDEDDIVLDIAAFEIDVLTFRSLAMASDRGSLQAATGLCEGELLAGLELDSEEFESWRRLEAARHADQAIDIFFRLMRLLTQSAETDKALEAGARILALDPLHEATARHMMALYAQNGRRGAAIQIYRGLATALQADANTQPDAETRRLFARIANFHAQAETVLPSPIDRPGEETANDRHVVSFAKRHRVALAASMAVFLAGLALFLVHFEPPAHPIALRPAAAKQSRPITIAVLPFDNLSNDPSQRYFSDGMTEEISAALAKVPGLQLVARSSVFQLRDSRDVRQVGSALGARYVIEGAVRRKDNRVRITARLIRTEGGVSVWSDSYERELTDIFAIQEDIATAIAEALRVSLGLASGRHLVFNRDIDPQAYEQFLRARPLMRARFTGVPQAIDILEPLVARNPDYAPAWAVLASCYAMMPAFLSPYQVAERKRRIQTFWPKAEKTAHRALQLDPELPDAYFALARMETLRGRPLVAENLLAKALALDPNYPDALALQVEIFANMGWQRQALETAQRLGALEPYVPTWKEDAAEVMWENGQSATAIEALKSLIARPAGPTSLAMMLASEGRYQDAAAILETALRKPDALPPGWPDMFRTAADLLKKAPAKVALPARPASLDRAGFVYLYVGAPAHALDMYEDTIKSGLAGGQGNSFSYLWHASYAPLRASERFKSLARNAGMVDYWRQRGWPDRCRPIDADDFVCH
jgi:TolB-like protein/DNA-binding SARP family transcriptional activator